MENELKLFKRKPIYKEIDGFSFIFIFQTNCTTTLKCEDDQLDAL